METWTYASYFYDFKKIFTRIEQENNKPHKPPDLNFVKTPYIFSFRKQSKE
jgi:hypothetical protein